MRYIIEMNRFVWIKVFSMVLKIRYLFHIFEPSSPYYTPDSCENHPCRVFLAEFSESEVKITWFRRLRNLLGKYRLLISFLRVIRPSDCDLKYHFGPKVLEYGRKKLCLHGFLQLVFDLISPLYQITVIQKWKKRV